MGAPGGAGLAVTDNDVELSEADPTLAALIARDVDRQRNHIQLIASENIVDRAMMEASGSVLANKYSEGYPGRRYYEGCEIIDEIEQLAIDRAKQLFGAEHANVQAQTWPPTSPSPSRATPSWGCASTREATSPTGRP